MEEEGGCDGRWKEEAGQRVGWTDCHLRPRQGGEEGSREHASPPPCEASSENGEGEKRACVTAGFRFSLPGKHRTFPEKDEKHSENNNDSQF